MVHTTSGPPLQKLQGRGTRQTGILTTVCFLFGRFSVILSDKGLFTNKGPSKVDEMRFILAPFLQNPSPC
jgi:hypothetical protein